MKTLVRVLAVGIGLLCAVVVLATLAGLGIHR